MFEAMKTIQINGNDFSDLTGFYRSLEKYLLEGECPWGENFDSLQEIVFSCFNYTDDRNCDVKKFIWKNFAKSQRDIQDKKNGQTVMTILQEILSANPGLQFIAD